MNLFFYRVNTIIMKKIIFIILFFFNICYVYGIEDIEINNEYLIPKFESNIKVYNYYTSKDIVTINVKGVSNEIIYGSGIHELKDGKNTIKISSSLNNEYTINIFKDYKKDTNKGYLESLNIKGYNINYDKNTYEYYIYINDEEYLDIDYKLSSDNTTFSISGNGNFNNTDNIIKINVNDEEYLIHAYKTINVSYIKEEDDNEMSKSKKEIVIFLIATISCILVFIYFYSLFIFN